MTNNEKKFWDILTNLFVGAEVKGKSGFINLMVAKQSYFKKVKIDLLKQINDTCKDNKDFKDELYDKLYSFFHRYFSESGSIYYNYTPLFYNIYTKAYNENPTEIKTFSTDYEQIISNKQDTSLFYKTQMLYYVKSDKIFKDLEIEIENKKYIFDVSNMEGKKANEKKNLVYELKSIENKLLTFNVFYNSRGQSDAQNKAIIKEAKKLNIEVKEEELKKAFRVFETQSNVDYFINKDAKRFLTEQLDMWIYQYMFSQEVDFNLERFSQIQDFKKVASKLINFISQFENELVKIWNKPRFVINSNIVVTIDKLIDKGFEIDKLRNHPNFNLQQEEWEELGISQGNGFVENEFLPIDTKYFPEFKDEIESLFNEDEFDGLLIKSENYQALNTIQPRFKGKVDLIYIDPPYNTGEDGFIYKDTFKDSTWLSMMNDRLELSNNFLNKKGIFYCSIDDNEMAQLKILSDKVFKQSNFVGNIAWESKTKSQNTKDSYNKLQPKIEYILCYSKKEKPRFNLIKLGEKEYPYNDEVGVYREYTLEVMDSGGVRGRETMVYPIKGIEPPKGKQWKWGESTINEFIERDDLFIQNGTIILKMRPEDESQDINQPFWAFIGKEEGTAESGKKELSHILNHDLNTIKPVNVIKKLIFHATNKEATILDFFAGSATTVEAILRLNNEDIGRRKFIAIEMGEHFDKIILPRIKKIIFSKDWRNQEAQSNSPLNAVFKYYELEQYEQILRSTKYKDTPSDYLDSKKSNEIKDCFLFDEKLSEVIISENDSFRVDLSKLYPNIDLKETIHNLTGKRPKEITDTKVIFEDKEYELLEILKPLLVW